MQKKKLVYIHVILLLGESYISSCYITLGAAEPMWNLNERALTGKTTLNYLQASERST